MQTSLARPDLCIFGRRYADKAACLGDLAGEAAVALNLERASILQALTKREALGSTGLGGGIALPHARLPAIVRPYVLFASLREPIAFDAVDERPIDLLCMLLLPSEPTTSDLALMSCWTRLLRDKTKADAIRSARSPEAVYEHLEGPMCGQRGSLG